ncbi:RING-H2 finger protein ATL13-like [Carya illinoinensis]|uniref:RING-type E3 ubiquitin transferase n=1 Tax=Carya illinoinensis TaxID=32201 RepID=A0A8T1PIF2_CARIL|nr:RING-H2 finger protein ATL13-like [Carya illinoinensis]KAG6644206.1 hypothetical protein CIPAW_08G040100 [Carya illinoinensis]
MERLLLEIKDRNFAPPTQSYFLSQPPPRPPPTLQSDIFRLNDKVNPSVLLIIIILAIIFFVSGLLHLLVRFLRRPQNRDPHDLESVTAFQGQLQQLFLLHDAGVDQSFIDTLPIFHYKAIIGLKNPFDCAVCLCEFEPEDKLRLLPKCSHAFHMECIDTWLLSHSTCPLCRASLLPDFSPNRNCSPVVLVLESGSESSREIIPEAAPGRTSSVGRTDPRLGSHCVTEFGSARIDLLHKSGDLGAKDDPRPTVTVNSKEKVVPVKLGKFRNVDGGEGSSGNNVDARRCFSMGSFEYVMDENSSLQVPIKTPVKKQSSKKLSLPLTPGHRLAMSEYDGESRREFNFNGFDAIGNFEADRGPNLNSNANGNGSAIGRSKRESFSVSKIWLQGKKEKPNASADASRRAVSFRFPVHQSVVAEEDLKAKNGDGGARRSISEINIGRRENGGNELCCDEDRQSYNNLDSQAKVPSFARRTLLWLTGKQNKVVHSSSVSNV